MSRNTDVCSCFSCRYYPAIAIDNGLEIRVDERIMQATYAGASGRDLRQRLNGIPEHFGTGSLRYCCPFSAIMAGRRRPCLVGGKHIRLSTRISFLLSPPSLKWQSISAFLFELWVIPFMGSFYDVFMHDCMYFGSTRKNMYLTEALSKTPCVPKQHNIA